MLKMNRQKTETRIINTQMQYGIQDFAMNFFKHAIVYRKVFMEPEKLILFIRYMKMNRKNVDWLHQKKIDWKNMSSDFNWLLLNRLNQQLFNLLS